MSNNIKWKTVEHSGSRESGKHLILVGYKNRGSGVGKVVCASPLYDLRDFNLDGSTSFLEKAFASAFYDPYELNSLLLPAAEADFKIEAGRAVKDYFFIQEAQEGFLRHAYKATARAAITISVEKILGPGIERTLAVSALEKLGSAGQAAMFVIQMGLETVIMESVARTSIR